MLLLQKMGEYKKIKHVADNGTYNYIKRISTMRLPTIYCKLMDRRHDNETVIVTAGSIDN